MRSFLCTLLFIVFPQLAVAETPNILVILADDMGYGDPECYNSESKCVTPNLNELAASGMMFTDAHSAGAVCVPSRYGLMTGRYPFRAKLNWQREGVIDAAQTTLASFLKSHAYQTAMLGKWHLGFDGGPDYDYSKPLHGGPVDRGFMTFLGMHASLDIPPYFYIRENLAVMPPTETVAASQTDGWSPIQGAFWRSGAVAPDFQHDQVLDRFAAEAVSRIKELQRREQRFFCYVALPAPHTPWLPAQKFQGRGEAGLYSEFVAHVDDVVGRILSALDAEAVNDTLVLFSSDNGPVWYDDDEVKYGHRSCGPLRGMKGDAWEGGHRVPFIARWPGRIPKASQSDHLIGFVDLLSTCADLIDAELPNGAGEDSVSFLPSLLGTAAKSSRDAIVLHHNGTVIRKGNWKLITHLGSGGFSEPRKVAPESSGPTGQLYNLADDLGETHNLWLERPDTVRELQRLRSESVDEIEVQ